MTAFTFKKHPCEFGEFRMRLYMNGKPVGKSMTFYVDQSFETIAKRLLITFTTDKSRPMEQRHQAVELCKKIRAQGAAAIPWHGQPQPQPQAPSLAEKVYAAVYGTDRDQAHREKWVNDIALWLENADDAGYTFTDADIADLAAEYKEYQAPARHHPDCHCNECYYGADLAKWRFNPSEY